MVCFDVRLGQCDVLAGRLDRFMSEHLLERQNRSAGPQVEDGRGVPQRVRGAARQFDPCQLSGTADQAVQAGARQAPAGVGAAVREEQWRLGVLLLVTQVLDQRLLRLGAEIDGALLVALAEHHAPAAVEVDVLLPQARRVPRRGSQCRAGV